MKPASLDAYREMARRRLPRFLFNYIEGGSFSGTTLARNVSDLQRVELRQRVLRDVSQIGLSVELFGETFALPAGLGPVGLAGMNARRGEVQAVQAAEAAGAPFCLSTVSLCPLEEVSAAAVRPYWFQLYMARDRGFVADMLARAQAAGCSVLVLTVDLAVPGARNRKGGAGLGTPGLAGAAARFAEAVVR
ncbi:MAG: alpha-hydroxy-acid oxidizing protein, partial [Caulobacterales bacterium]|uniref:alpha-hydroxy-acid oxidizing protein n=1 Tax=Glycocaulis sp. TaxID=1969725 RepID=UPI003F9EFD64